MYNFIKEIDKKQVDLPDDPHCAKLDYKLEEDATVSVYMDNSGGKPFVTIDSLDLAFQDIRKCPKQVR